MRSIHTAWLFLLLHQASSYGDRMLFCAKALPPISIEICVANDIVLGYGPLPTCNSFRYFLFALFFMSLSGRVFLLMRSFIISSVTRKASFDSFASTLDS